MNVVLFDPNRNIAHPDTYQIAMPNIWESPVLDEYGRYRQYEVRWMYLYGLPYRPEASGYSRGLTITVHRRRTEAETRRGAYWRRLPRDTRVGSIRELFARIHSAVEAGGLTATVSFTDGEARALGVTGPRRVRINPDGTVVMHQPVIGVLPDA